MKKLVLLAILSAFSYMANAITYYFQSGALEIASNWNTDPSGAGIAATGFTSALDVWDFNGKSTGTVTASSTWTVAGDIQAGAAFVLNLGNSASLTLAGEFIGASNIFIQGLSSNILTLSGAASDLPEMTSINTLQLGGSGTKTATGNISVTNIFFSGTASLDMVTFTFSVTSITAPSAHALYTQNGGATPIPAITYPAGLLVDFSSAGGNQTIPAGCTFEAGLTISNGSQTTAAGNLTTNGTLTISGSSSLDMNTFKVQGTGTIAGVGTSSFLTANTDTDPFPDNSSFYSIQYDGAANQYIPDGTSLSHNLVLSTNDTVFANGSLEVDNAIVFLSNSSLDMGTGQLTGTLASLTFSGTHYFRTAHLSTLPYPDGLDFSNSGMTVDFYGAGDQLIPGGTLSHAVIANLVLSGSGTKQLTTARKLTVGNNGGTLIVEPGVALTADLGTELTLDGSVATLQADATSYGQLQCLGTFATTNSPTISRETYLDLTTPRYFNLSSGLDGATLASFAESGASIVASSGATGSVWSWDASNQSWTAPSSTAVVANPDVGYTIFGGNANGADFLRSGSGTISVDGTGLRAVDELFTLTYSDSTASTNTSLFAGGASGWGWNLIANPYTATYDWDSQTVPTGAINTIYIWTGSNYSSHSSGVDVNGGSRYIPPGQAFWIQTTSTPLSALLLDYTKTVPAVTETLLKTAPDHVKLILSDNQGVQHDEIAVRFDPSATPHFDSELDGHKLGAGYGVPYIFIMQNQEAYSICSNNDSTTVYKVHIRENKGPNQLRLSLNSDHLQAFTDVYLEDLKTHTITRLSDGGYYSFAHTDQDDEDRFRLIFSNESIGIEEDHLNSITAAVIDGKLQLFNTQEEEHVRGTVIDMNGRVLKSFDWTGTPVDLSGLSRGIYIVRIESGSQFITAQRVVLR